MTPPRTALTPSASRRGASACSLAALLRPALQELRAHTLLRLRPAHRRLRAERLALAHGAEEGCRVAEVVALDYLAAEVADGAGEVRVARLGQRDLKAGELVAIAARAQAERLEQREL